MVSHAAAPDARRTENTAASQALPAKESFSPLTPPLVSQTHSHLLYSHHKSNYHSHLLSHGELGIEKRSERHSPPTRKRPARTAAALHCTSQGDLPPSQHSCGTETATEGITNSQETGTQLGPGLERCHHPGACSLGTLSLLCIPRLYIHRTLIL